MPHDDSRKKPHQPEDAQELRLLNEAILQTMRQPLVVLNEDLTVVCANRSFYATFEVGLEDTEGMAIYDLGNGQWNVPELRRLLEEILPRDREVNDYKVEHEFKQIGRRVIKVNARRIERSDRQDLILLALDDVTEREDLLGELEGQKELAEKIVDASRDALLILDWDLRVKSANDTFLETFKVDRAETEGKMVYELGNGQWNIPKLRELLENVLPDDEVFNDYEVEHDFEEIGHRIMVLNGRRVDHLQLILLAMEDKTEERRAVRALKESEARLSALMSHAPLGLGLVDADGRIILANPALERLSLSRIPSTDPELAKRWHPDPKDLPPENWPVARSLRGEAVAPGVDFRVAIEGEERWLRIGAAPVRGDDEGERIECAVAIVEDVTERKQIERQSELLLGELNHRVKNIFSIIRALASRGETAGSAEEFRQVFLARLDALSNAHNLALEGRWETVDMLAIAQQTLKPYRGGQPGTIVIDGQSLEFPARSALSVSLALHELATNAVKFGALSTSEGQVHLTWEISDTQSGQVHLVWEELGGPPASPPERPGFGTQLIEQVFDYQLEGVASLQYRETGLRLEATFSPG